MTNKVLIHQLIATIRGIRFFRCRNLNSRSSMMVFVHFFDFHESIAPPRPWFLPSSLGSPFIPQSFDGAIEPIDHRHTFSSKMICFHWATSMQWMKWPYTAFRPMAPHKPPSIQVLCEPLIITTRRKLETRFIPDAFFTTELFFQRYPQVLTSFLFSL